LADAVEDAGVAKINFGQNSDLDVAGAGHRPDEMNQICLLEKRQVLVNGLAGNAQGFGEFADFRFAADPGGQKEQKFFEIIIISKSGQIFNVNLKI